MSNLDKYPPGLYDYLLKINQITDDTPSLLNLYNTECRDSKTYQDVSLKLPLTLLGNYTALNFKKSTFLYENNTKKLFIVNSIKGLRKFIGIDDILHLEHVKDFTFKLVFRKSKSSKLEFSYRTFRIIPC